MLSGLVTSEDDTIYPCTQAGEDSLVLLSYTSSGDPDTSFGDDGQVSVALEAGETILFLVARFDSDGQIDTGFGGDGFETADFASTGGLDFACAPTVQTDDKIVVAGVAGSFKLVEARYTP